MRLLSKAELRDRGTVDAAQEENFAAMRRAVSASDTCKAFAAHAADLTPENIERIPVTTREQLAEWGSRRDAPNRITLGQLRLVLRSSGSSGRVRTMLHDRPLNDRCEALGARGLARDELSDNPFVINCLTSGDLFGAGGFVEASLARSGAAVLPAGTSVPISHLAELIEDLDVEAVVAPPAYLQKLHETVPASLARMRVLYYLGDRIDPKLVGDLEAQGPVVRSFAFSTTETAPIGYQCAALRGTDHHVHEDLVHTEILDHDGGRTEDGEWGDLAVTVLADTGAALVRYMVGDLAMRVPGECPCGDATKVIRIGGRDATSAAVNTEIVTQAMFAEALAPLGSPSPTGYQVVHTTGGGRFRLTLVGPALKGLDPDRVREAVAGHQSLRLLTGAKEFDGLHVDADAPQRTTARGKAPFFWTEEHGDES